jgi:hypothetical protein
MDFDFTPEDQPPDEDFQVIGVNARMAAHYYRTLSESGLCEYVCVELTKEWMNECFERGAQEPDG